MENKTYYDELKAKVRWSGGRWTWNIYSYEGQLMAGGEEFRLHHAMEAANETVFAIRRWATSARGTITPSTDGRRWFTFENTEGRWDK